MPLFYWQPPTTAVAVTNLQAASYQVSYAILVVPVAVFYAKKSHCIVNNAVLMEMAEKNW